MIELFDASRLVARRDHSLPLAALALALAAGGLSVYASNLQSRLRAAEADKLQLVTTLRETSAVTAPSPTLLVDLERQLQGLDAEALAVVGNPGPSGMPPSAWLDRLESLGNTQVSLSRIDIERAGSARLEGLAASAQAVSAFVQAFSAKERQDPGADVRARAVELRHDKASAPYLRFTLRASAAQQEKAAQAPVLPNSADAPANQAALKAAPAAGAAAPEPHSQTVAQRGTRP